MPIRPENRDRYPKDWKRISREVREDAGNRCEWCHAPNGAMIFRGAHDTLPAWRLARSSAYDVSYHAHTGVPIPGSCWDTFQARAGGPVKVVLTVAHLDHTPENCERENLRALCQSCHNRYDMANRRRGIAERAKADRADGDLFA